VTSSSHNFKDNFDNQQTKFRVVKLFISSSPIFAPLPKKLYEASHFIFQIWTLIPGDFWSQTRSPFENSWILLCKPPPL